MADPFREYPWRVLGYSNALMRPVREFLPKQLYQASFAVMHVYFLANAYDYSLRTDSKSQLRSAFDCYSWHCAASWIGPAFVMDNIRRLCLRSLSSSKLVAGLGSYVSLGLVSPILDRSLNWYFYGFWSGGTKQKPRLLV